jgi:hypothetical protein
MARSREDKRLEVPRELTEEEKAGREEFKTALEDVTEKLDEACDELNEAVRVAWEKFAVSVDAYNEVVEKGNVWAADIEERLSIAYDDIPSGEKRLDTAKALRKWAGSYGEPFEGIEIEAPDEVEFDGTNLEILADLADELEV